MSKEYQRPVSILGNLPIAGNIIFHDDFSGLLKWEKYLGIGDDIWELDPSVAKQGNQSLYFRTRLTGAFIHDEIGARRNVHLLPSQIITAILSFQYAYVAATESIYFVLDFYNGTYLHTATILYNPNIPSWQYLDSGGNPQTITDFDTTLRINAWHNIQIKATFATQKYISLIVDHLKADLSSLSFQSTLDDSDSTFIITAYISTSGAAPTNMRLDQVILHEV